MADLQTRYAKALFELAIERGLTADYKEQAVFISSAMSDPEAKRIITHPRIPMKEKFAFLDGAFSGHVHDDLLGFMRLTVTKNREEFLAPAMDNLVEMIRRHQNYTTAKIVSAMPLTDEQILRLRRALMRKLGKQVEIETNIDTSLIGGFRLHVDGHIFDRSLKQMLKEMKENLI